MMRNIFLILILPYFIILKMAAQEFEHFISVYENKLMDGSGEFRFLSFNIPNLNFIEDEMAFTTYTAFRLPTEFEIRDALLAVKQAGGRVARIYTIPVKRSEQLETVPAFVLGPGIFNEDAFRINDVMLALANEIGIRIIFPLLNNWKWMGGRPQYAAFREKNKNEFWTDPQLIEDFKSTIKYTLNRTNTISGIKYKDDKAILCWETGNELGCPPEWTAMISRYIKQLDNHHLVMDGYFAGHRRYVRVESLEDPAVDILSSHHYEYDPDETVTNIKRNIEIINNKKPYIIGEFGFQSTTALSKTMDWIISEPAIAGALIWSLRSHREEGGFYWHSEPLGQGIFKAYHWPGFSSGHSYDEIDILQIMKKKAYTIQGLLPPKVEKPASPKLLPINDVFNINWQGSAGASFYDIVRSEKPDGPWDRIAINVSDAAVQYSSLYHDKSAVIGKEYYYRLIAGNCAGKSEPSNVIGPVRVSCQALIDNMSNFGKMLYSRNVSLKSGEDRKYKEDIFRIAGHKESEIIYFIPGKYIQANIYSFETTEIPALLITASSDGINYNGINNRITNYYEHNNDYFYWYPLLYEVNISEKDITFLKIHFNGIAQISRIEIIYK